MSFSGRFCASAGIDKKAKFSGGKRTGRFFFPALLLGVFLAFFWWVLSASLHVYLFGYADSFLGEFFSSDPHVLFMRGFVALLIIFSVILTRALLMRGDMLHDLRMARELREKQLLRSLMEDAPLPAMLHAEDGEVLMVNRAWREVTGYSPEDIPTTDEWVRRAYGESASNVKEQITATYGFSDRTEEGDFEIRTRDGERRILKFTSSPVGCGEDAGRRLVLSVADDITERKERENEWRELLERMINAFVIFDSVFDENGEFVSYRFVYINKAYEDITGVSLEDVRGRTVHEVWPGTEDSWVEAYGKVATTGRASAFEMYHGPTEKLYYCQAYRPYSTNKRFCVVFEDITGRVGARKAREAAENRYKQLFDRSLDGIVACDLEGRIVDCNRAYREMLGYGLEELRGVNFRQITPEKWREREERIVVEGIKQRGFSGVYEKEYIKKDGSVVPVELSSYLIKDSEGRPEGMWGIVRDITERKRREMELRRSEELNRLTLSSIPDSVFLTDNRGNFKFVCSGADVIFGKSVRDIEEQHTIHNLLGGDELPISELSPGELRTEERRVTGVGGEEKYLLIITRGVRFMGSSTLIICRDDTARIKARQELVRREADLAGVFRAVPAGVGVVNNRVISWGNELLSKITGYRVDELSGLDVRYLYPTREEYERVGKEFYSMLKKTGQAELEIELRRKDGRDITALLRGAEIKGAYPKGDIVFAMLDVTAAKASKERLRLTQYAVDKAGLEIFWIDPEGRFIYANEKARDSLGYGKEDLERLHIWDIDPFFPKSQRREMWESLKHTGALRFESVHRRSDGEEYPVEVNSYNIEFQDSELEIAFARDITERKKVMNALVETKTRYKSLFDNMINAVAVYEAVDGGKDFIFKDLNDAGQRLEKLQKADVAGKRVTDLFPGVEEFGLLDVMRSVYKSGCPRSFPVHFYKDRRRSGWRKNYVYKLPTGEVICVYEDVSEKKRAEQERADLFQLSIDMFSVAGFNGYFKQINPAWEKTLGWSRKELLSRKWIDFVHEEDLEKTLEAAEALRRGESIVGFENRYRCREGSYKWISWNAYSIPEKRSIMAVARDITDDRRKREKLRLYKKHLEKLVALRTRKLEETNRELESFSYSVSHDLRAPLRAINGFSGMLQEDFRDKLGREGGRMLNVIKKNTKTMSALIDSLLRYSRLGRKAMYIEDIDMEKLTGEIFREQLYGADEKKVRILTGEMPAARGDRVMIRQVLSNLISNALKYTNKQRNPRIEAGGYKEGENNVYYVKDNGVGFDMEYAGKIFEVFQRLHSEKDYGGTGVGLGLVQRAVHKHGGKVWAESEPGKGAAFYFSIPAQGPPSLKLTDPFEEGKEQGAA